MGKIQELSETLANQIAAGEVVERPASVVKELVENAIDAHATQIDILILEAGLKEITVIDNGEGIEPEDVANAFKRHATSKIHVKADLFRIKSLGFRGEALPSIASVSKLTMETSTGEHQGTHIELAGGKITDQRAFGLRKGTKITVQDLFYNTPARLKYVKTFNTELATIGDIVNRLAMSHPQIAFSLTHEGNRMIHTHGNGDLRQTIAGIYGISSAKKMISIENEDLDFKIGGFISLPELTRASKQYISLIINGRYIRNFALNKAIIAGYGSKLMIGRYPFAVIEIQMDPLLVDVNVHPTKQEVRLSKEPELQNLLTLAIRVALQTENLIPNASQNLEEALQKKRKAPETQIEQPSFFGKKTSERQAIQPVEIETQEITEGDNPVELEKWDQRYQNESTANAFESSVKNPSGVKTSLKEMKQDWKADSVAESVGLPLKKVENTFEETNQQPRFPELEYIGQMHGTYLLAQSGDGLYILDQHAAQERVKYEYYRQKIGEVSDDAQTLLLPIILEYPVSDALKIEENKEKLQALGLYLEPFGQNTFKVSQHPTWFKKGEEESIIREMVDYLLKDNQLTIAKFREKTAIMMSCKRSIKANHHLDERQAKALLHDLPECENPFNCPHGRPVLVHFTVNDMEKMFKRIQDPHHTKEVEE